MTDIDITKHKSILKATFRYFVDYLEKQKIPYFAIAGTALGAKRHSGIIPWDDDVDIYIPRPDYERLLSLNKDKLHKDNYDIVSLRDEGYYLPYAKFFYANTTIWEAKQWPYLIGVWIDIFPLDYVDISYSQVVERQKGMMNALYKYQRCVAKTSFCDVVRLLLDKHPHLATDYFYGLVYPRKKAKKYLDEFNSRLKELTVEKGDHCIFLFGPRKEKEYFPSSWFKEYREVPFEDFKIRVPGPLEEYLTFVFGDYMQLPPMEERVPKHDLYYYNLDEKIEIEEIKRRKK